MKFFNDYDAVVSFFPEVVSNTRIHKTMTHFIKRKYEQQKIKIDSPSFLKVQEYVEQFILIGDKYGYNTTTDDTTEDFKNNTAYWVVEILKEMGFVDILSDSKLIQQFENELTDFVKSNE